MLYRKLDDDISNGNDFSNLSLINQLSYLTSLYNWDVLESLEHVREDITDILQLNNKEIFLWVAWLSWSWKWTLLHILQQILDWEKVLKSEKQKWPDWKKIIDENWKYVKLLNEKGWYLLKSWYTFDHILWNEWIINLEKHKSILLLELDWFFKLDDRYTTMLESEEKFKDMYFNNDKVLKVINNFLTKMWEFSVDWIYQKTPNERIQKKWLSRLKINKKEKSAGKVLVFDWVNSSQVIDLYNGSYRNKKKMFEYILMLSPNLKNVFWSFCRVLNRDVIWKNRDLDTIVEYRLKETFYVMKIFVLEALKKGLFKESGFTLVDLPHLTDNHLDKSFMRDVINKIDEKRDILLNEDDLNEELYNFIEEYAAFLIERFRDEIS